MKMNGTVEIALAPDYNSWETYQLNFCQGKDDNFLLGKYTY